MMKNTVNHPRNDSFLVTTSHSAHYPTHSCPHCHPFASLLFHVTFLFESTHYYYLFVPSHERKDNTELSPFTIGGLERIRRRVILERVMTITSLIPMKLYTRLSISENQCRLSVSFSRVNKGISIQFHSASSQRTSFVA